MPSHSSPKGQFKYFVELRNPEWFINKEVNDGLYDNLHHANMGMVITDTPAFRNFVQMKFPIPSTFIRFVYKGNEESDIFRIQQWKLQLDYLAKQGVNEAFFFTHSS